MEARFKTLQIIWAAMLAGVVAYTAVLFVVLRLGMVEMPVLPAWVMTVGASVVLVYMAGVTVVRRRMVEAIPAGAAQDTRFAQYQTATIVGLALLEGGGLLLISLGILADSSIWVLAGGGASLWMMALARPQRSEAGIGEPGRGLPRNC